MEKLKILQIGSGGWGRSWFGFLDEAEDWELSGLVSRGGTNLEQAQAQWHIPADRCFTDLDDALSGDADAVLVTVPHHLHVDLCRRALEAGKHVLCEKPFSDRFDTARDLVAFAATTDRVLAVSQNFRYREGLHQLKALIGAGAGRIDSMSVELREPQGSWLAEGWRAHQVSPLLLEVLIHQVDMARFLCGADPVTVYCRAWNPPWSITSGPVSADVLVTHTDGTRLTYMGTWATRGGQTPWDGEWCIRYQNTVATWQGGEVRLFPHNGTELNVPAVPEFPGYDRTGVLADFAAAVRGDAPFPTDGRDNLKSLAVIFAAIRSFQEHRDVSIEEIMGE